MAAPWNEFEVFQLTMSSPISDIHGVGPRTIELLSEAGLRTVGDLLAVHSERAIQAALPALKRRYPDLGFAYWARLVSRCATVIERVRQSDASPFLPDEYCCPITGDWMHDPVVTPHGESYERQAIEQWIVEHGKDPFTRDPIQLSQLYPNRKLKDAIDNYKRMFHRYSVPLRIVG